MENESPDSPWRLVSLTIKVAIFTYIGLTIYNAILPYGMNLHRVWDPYTKLRPFERRITDVASEFLRRSEGLRNLVHEYGECQPKCTAEFYARKEAVIREDWPDVFARLRIKNDWSEAMINKSYSYDQVGIIVDEYKDLAPIMCVPKITLSYTKATGPYAYFEKFVCVPSP